ncbi:MAG: hypothetical protein IJR64_07250 [Bacteroidales bacterium]|nr:hypothetical protein [Bacteroidales bacterium]
MTTLILCLTSTACSINGSNIFSINNGELIPNSQFIETPFLASEDMNLGLTQTTLFSANGVTISLEKYLGWEEDPGYFTVIKSITNNVPLLIKSSVAWDRIPESFRTNESDYFIRVPLNENYTAFIFMGYPFDSRPPLLTIIVIGDGQAKLVFNKKYHVYSINNTSDSFSMIIKDGYADAHTILTFHIWRGDGVLKIEPIYKFIPTCCFPPSGGR